MFENTKYQKISTMVTNLNEECLLRFLKSADENRFGTKATLPDLLRSFGVEIKFKNQNALYDIIDEYEYT